MEALFAGLALTCTRCAASSQLVYKPASPGNLSPLLGQKVPLFKVHFGQKQRSPGPSTPTGAGRHPVVDSISAHTHSPIPHSLTDCTHTHDLPIIHHLCVTSIHRPLQAPHPFTTYNSATHTLPLRPVTHPLTPPLGFPSFHVNVYLSSHYPFTIHYPLTHLTNIYEALSVC